MKKTSKLSLLILGTFLLTSVAFVSCNNSGDEKKEAPKDSVAAPKMDAPPPAADTTKKMDSANKKPEVLPKT